MEHVDSEMNVSYFSGTTFTKEDVRTSGPLRERTHLPTAKPSPNINSCEGGSCSNEGCFPIWPSGTFFGNGYTWLFLLFAVILIVLMLWLINSTSGQKTAWYNSMDKPWPFQLTWMLSIIIVIMVILFWLSCSFGTVNDPRINCAVWGFFLVIVCLFFWSASFFWKHMMGLSMAFLILTALIVFWMGWVIGVSNPFKITGFVLLCIFALFLLFLIYYNAGFWYKNPDHNGIP